jgi:hypothetical protein
MSTYIKTFEPDLHRVLTRLTQTGRLTLAMLYKSSDALDGWNFIVSASWSDRLGRAQATSVVTRALSEELSLENKRIVSRVTVLSTSDPFVQDITSRYQVASPGTEQWVTNISAGGIPIGIGYIFLSTSD